MSTSFTKQDLINAKVRVEAKRFSALVKHTNMALKIPDSIIESSAFAGCELPEELERWKLFEETCNLKNVYKRADYYWEEKKP